MLTTCEPATCGSAERSGAKNSNQSNCARNEVWRGSAACALNERDSSQANEQDYPSANREQPERGQAILSADEPEVRFRFLAPERQQSECETRPQMQDGESVDQRAKHLRSGPNGRGDWLCGLTFELRGRNRGGAWPAKRMMTASASRAKCHAGGGPARAKG